VPPTVRTPAQIVRFVDDLAAAVVPGCCNIYADGCDDSQFDGPQDGPARRRENLCRYLTAHWDAPIVLVGEAPGYKGARVCGVPLTSAFILDGYGEREGTATMVHEALRDFDLARHVLLWNAVPWHPHKPGEPRTNRRPGESEIAAGRPFLERVTKDRLVVPVGDVAAKTVGAAGIRHPQNGGKSEFRAGLEMLRRQLTMVP
jgi:uracil-DNA glycosylase